MRKFRLHIKIELDNVKEDIYLLSPGQCLPNWGGSSGSLLVEKSPSLVSRRIDSYGAKDYETDIDNKTEWARIIGMINCPGAKVSICE